MALLSYGNKLTLEDLKRIEDLLVKRFSIATNGLLDLEVISKKKLKFKHALPHDYKFKKIEDKERLHRIWYYENIGVRVLKEIYREYKAVETDEIMNQLDMVLSITGAQFEGLGGAIGRITATEYPREIAWGAPGGGRVDFVSDYSLVDELIHEIGHNLNLDHAANQCQSRRLNHQQKKECCEKSQNKDDVMSYCRERKKVGVNNMFGFEGCNLSNIEKIIKPSIINGNSWVLPGIDKCN